MFKKYISTFAALAIVAGGAAVLAESAGSDEAQGSAIVSNVWEGAYTDGQAARGQEVYEASCMSCHAATLRGTPGGPGIAGGRFTFNWHEESVGELLGYVRDNMPIGQAGTLSDQQYADVVAYILQVNEFPAGEAELAVDPEASGELLILRTAE